MDMRVFTRIAIVLCMCTAALYGENIRHTVVKGDTLYSLAKKYGVTVDEIKTANAMNANDLYAGQKLTIPAKKVPRQITYESYTVEAGDTLYGIARRYDISIEELREINGLSSNSVLKTSQKLKVPSKTGSLAQGAVYPAVSGSSSSSASTEAALANAASGSNASVSAPPALIDSDKGLRSYTKKTGDANLVWPVKASEVLYVSGKISGVALTGGKNEHVTAIRSGTVMFSGVYRGFGQVVFVQAPNGLIYVYTGLDTLSVAKGQQVNYGQQLGVIGSDPISGKNLINLMVFKNGTPIDPAKAPRG
ncbi:LysM peptidoglycan-binding domain-containing M23 family metallopeptidase [Treponema sp. HNW]|uniref:LysM peptidoglycan-binding domain-containing protein n=1 Tax=Treponema sp. HNW TaxID=3116654 RepID=UPI003D0F7593